LHSFAATGKTFEEDFLTTCGAEIIKTNCEAVVITLMQQGIVPSWVWCINWVGGMIQALMMK
jgi:hypothetical protein